MNSDLQTWEMQSQMPAPEIMQIIRLTNYVLTSIELIIRFNKNRFNN